MKLIRPVKQSDFEGLKAVLDSSGLFPAELLDDMISDFLTNPESEDIWFTQIQNEKPIALGYCAPEKLAEGTYNLYAIAVMKELQGQGIGGEMMAYIEAELRKKSHRLLIIDTSSDPEFELTRKFYLKLGYKQEAVIRDFWKKGEDKIIFTKKLD